MIQDPQPQRRWPLVAGGVVAGVALLAGGGALGWAWLNDAVAASSATPLEGSQMEVALYTPDAPAVEAGGVMDVGQLSDGYEHRVRAAADAGYDVEGDWAMAEEAREAAPTLRRPQRVLSSRDTERGEGDTAKPYAPEPQAQIRRLVEPPRRPNFGFDDPQPDYAGERRSRRERSDGVWRPVPSQPQPRSNWRPVQPPQTAPVPERHAPQSRPDEVDADGYAG